jgi:phosphomethylpyrimidine synthase
VPIGTVPIYSMIIGRRIEDLTESIILETLLHQAKQGVDYFTIHAGVLREHLPFVKDRLIGIVSRGGSLLAKWMIVHGKQNPMYTHFDEICDIMREYDVSFSWATACAPAASPTPPTRPSSRARGARRAHRARLAQGLPGHGRGPRPRPLRPDRIQHEAPAALCHGAPFYVLGPLVTDVFPGYDHITSCIGATAAAYHGASMLCYVTPKEHLGLPKRDDVKQGCIAYKIAAHAADVALGIPGTRDWDDDLTKARAALNWEKHFELSFDPDTARALHDEDLDVDTDFCAMCGHDWCSVRISKEIVEFASGKAEGYARERVMRSPGLTAEQRAILEQRGHLDPGDPQARRQDQTGRGPRRRQGRLPQRPPGGAPGANRDQAASTGVSHPGTVSPGRPCSGVAIFAHELETAEMCNLFGIYAPAFGDGPWNVIVF